MEKSERPIDPERPHATAVPAIPSAPHTGAASARHPIPPEEWPQPEEDDFSKYERPRLTTRLVAFTSDVMVLGISAYAMYGAYENILRKIMPHWTICVLLFIVVFFVYSVLFEASPLRGTPGKRLMGYVVVDTKGKRLSFWRVVARNLLRPVSFVTGGFMMMLFSPDGQMLHDKIVGAIAEGLPPER